MTEPPEPSLSLNPPAGFSPPVSLYLHFPFCVHRCHYCDFSVHRTSRAPVEEWIACLEREAGAWFDRAGWKTPLELETVFIGGGTPSLMGPRMRALRDTLSAYFDFGKPDLEWTAESNPASLSSDVAGDWRQAGVNRISIGVQSFDDSVLAWLGRLHDAREAKEAIDRALEAGFGSVNIDLIFGLPTDLPRDWSREVDTALEMGVTHVSTYGLTAEPRTPLGRRVHSGETRLAGEERYAEEYLSATEALEGAGFVHYEVSNFALPGHECRHNWHYWDGSSYLGLGPSAHSFIGGTRAWNVFRWEAYRRAVARGGDPLEGHETPGASESQLERLWLALRTRRGLDEREGIAEVELLSRADDLLEAWREAGWLQRGDPRHIRLSAEGWMRMDELVAELAGRLPRGG